jgi:DNA-binding SARP family transcriptional activator/tetratricopeptide (TPR) repeat protein
VEFRLLGPVEFRVGGEAVELGPPRQRLVLAALLVDAGRPVGWDALIDRVWPDGPPAGARGVLRANVARLRAVLGPADGLVRLGRGSGGYQIEVDPDRVDVHRFDGLAARAGGGVPAERAGLLREALDLWRGEPLYGLRGRWVEHIREVWSQRWLAAVVAWAEAATAAGNASAAVEPLFEAVRRFPVAENAVAALMRALAAAGEPARALAVYESTRQLLGRDLGTDPGPTLRALHLAVLRGELGTVPAVVGAARTARVVPAQLPADVAGFAGRVDDLSWLDGLLTSGPRDGRMVVISAVSGMGGVGKTAIAVHWAHRTAASFPDGQLYLNLRGFDPAGPPMPVAEALRVFLDALGVANDALPSTVDARVGLYRSLLAGRRVLVVLDNAHDAEQVRPLLPGTPGAVVLVTSRNQLTPLVVTDGAHPLTLSPLDQNEARELLVRRLGAARVAAEPAAVRGIVAACAGLPLALAIAAARARQTGFPLAGLAAGLSRPGQLDELDGGDPHSQVRAVFSWSYERLSSPAARLFRLLGVHPGPDISAAAAASLAGCPPDAVRPLLDELTQATMLDQPVPGRYALHDLLRAYAGELTDRDPAQWRGALVRTLDHYVHTGHRAERLINAVRDPIGVPLATVAAGVTPEELTDVAAATAWFTREVPVVLALLRRTAGAGEPARVWQLAWMVDTFLDRRSGWDDLVAAWGVVLPAAAELGPAAVAYAHRSLARIHGRLDQHEEAFAHHRSALDLYTAADDRPGQAYVNGHLAMTYWRHGDLDRALDHAARARDLFEQEGHLQGQVHTLNQIAWYLGERGDHAESLVYCRRALALVRAAGDLDAEAATWDTLGHTHHQLGQHGEAADCYERALALLRRVGDRYNEGGTLTRLGDTLAAAGDPGSARTAWDRALAILTELDHPDAAAVRARLAGRTASRAQ